jgi:hypothetical protein
MEYHKIKSIFTRLLDLNIIERVNYLDYFNASELAQLELYARRQQDAYTTTSAGDYSGVINSIYSAGVRNCGQDYAEFRF